MQNIGVCSHALLQGLFPTQRLNPGLPRCRQILHHLSHQGTQIPIEVAKFLIMFHFTLELAQQGRVEFGCERQKNLKERLISVLCRCNLEVARNFQGQLGLGLLLRRAVFLILWCLLNEQDDCLNSSHHTFHPVFKKKEGTKCNLLLLRKLLQSFIGYCTRILLIST